MNKGGIFFLSMLLFCASCGDADLFDTDKWSSKLEGWEPEVVLSVVKGNFSLWDLINQKEDSVIIREGNTLLMQYTKAGIDTIKVSQVFEMPEDAVSLGNNYEINSGATVGIPIENPIVIRLSLSNTLNHIPAGCDLRKMNFSADLLLPELNFSYMIDSVQLNGTLWGENIEVPASGEKISMESCQINFEESGKIVLDVKMTIPASTSLPDLTLPLNFALNHINYKWVEGKISVADPIEIKEGSFDMDIDFLNEIGGNFRFTRPELQLVLRNAGIGVPLQMIPEFIGSNKEGQSVTLTNHPGTVLMANGNPLQEMHTEYVVMNSGNSNIVDFLALPPQGEITYRGTIKVNPQEKDDNVVYNNGAIVLDACVRVPFDLHADSLIYRDTLTDIDIDEKWAKKIRTGRVRINAAKNELPLAIYIPELVFLDENNIPIDTVKISGEKNRIEASATNSFLEFELTRQQAHDLGRTKNIILLAVAETNDENQAGVSILADAKLEFSLLVEAQAVIDDYDDL